MILECQWGSLSLNPSGKWNSSDRANRSVPKEGTEISEQSEAKRSQPVALSLPASIQRKKDGQLSTKGAERVILIQQHRQYIYYIIVRQHVAAATLTLIPPCCLRTISE